MKNQKNWVEEWYLDRSGKIVGAIICLLTFAAGMAAFVRNAAELTVIIRGNQLHVKASTSAAAKARTVTSLGFSHRRKVR